MSDSEVSVEAAVAGEAAAAAVEEVHAREDIAIAASAAVSEASTAVDVAALAESQAADANENAAVAVETAVGAAESAQAIAGFTQVELDAFRAEQDDKLREMREYIDSRIPLPTPEPATPAVEEIEAENGTPRVSDSGDGSDSDGAPEKPRAQASREERYRLRRGRN